MEIVLLLVLGFVAGVFAGLFGVGGGILFVPTLVLVASLSQLEAEATSLLAIIPTVIAGAWQQQRYGNVRWRAALVVGVAAIAGVEAGVRVADALSEDVLQRLFALLMIAVAAQLAWRAARAKRGVRNDMPLDRSVQTDAPAKPARPDGRRRKRTP